MDRIEIHGKIKELFAKYKFVLLILAIGILFMSIPEESTPKPQEKIHVSNEKQTPAEELEDVLSQIEGVGRVKVLLTESCSPETIYQTDTDRTASPDSENIRVETNILTNSNREEAGLIRAVNAPVYLGAIIVCQGGDSPSIKLSVVQAVSNVTGISSDRITVLKMK